MKYVLPVLFLCVACAPKLKTGVYTAIHTTTLYGSETLSLALSSPKDNIWFSKERKAQECPPLYQSFTPSESIFINAKSALYTEENAKNNDGFSFHKAECGFDSYGGQWFSSEGVDTKTILCEKSITKELELPLEKGESADIQLTFMYTARVFLKKKNKGLWGLLQLYIDTDLSNTQRTALQKHLFDPDCRYATLLDLRPVQ